MILIPEHVHEWVQTDPTGGDPWMGGPVTIEVCAECGHERMTMEDKVSESIDQATARYADAAHAMQTAVALKMKRGIGKETEPKHLRVGINSAMSNMGGLVTLLISKGVITREEYYSAMADAMEREVALYREELDLPPNVELL